MNLDHLNHWIWCVICDFLKQFSVEESKLLSTVSRVQQEAQLLLGDRATRKHGKDS